MKIASGHSVGLVSGSSSAAAVTDPFRAAHMSKKAIALAGVFCLFVISCLLPPQLSQILLDIVSWCMVGAVAAAVLLAGVKFVEQLLD